MVRITEIWAKLWLGKCNSVAVDRCVEEIYRISVNLLFVYLYCELTNKIGRCNNVLWVTDDKPDEKESLDQEQGDQMEITSGSAPEPSTEEVVAN